MYDAGMDEGRKRVLAIVAGILVARHLKSTEDFAPLLFGLPKIRVETRALSVAAIPL